METKLKAYCGCQQSLQSNSVITPTEVIRWAQAHAEEFGHSLIFQGEIRMPKIEWNGRTRKHPKEVNIDHQR